MFGSAFIPLPKADENVPKRTPPGPTPVNLPVMPRVESRSIEPSDLRDIEMRLRLIKSYTKITHHLIELVGLQPRDSLSITEIIPDEGYLPSEHWLLQPSLSDGQISTDRSTLTLSNGASVPGHEAFYNRAKELMYDSEDAYRAVNRLPPLTAHKAVRVSQLRKFWLVLQQVGGFWDCSKDNISYQPQTHEPLQDPRVAATAQLATGRLSDGFPPTVLDTATVTDNNAGRKFQDTHGVKTQSSTDCVEGPPATGTDDSRLVDENESLSYTGRRHSTGSDMPNSMREELLRNFLEPILFAFGCRMTAVAPGIPKPKFVLGQTRFPCGHSGYIHRLPMDRNRNRQNFVEGPLMVLHCSPELSFGQEHIDLAFAMNELCIILSLAQERHREGKSRPSKPSNWWEQVNMNRAKAVAIGEPLFDAQDGDLASQQKSNADAELAIARKRVVSWTVKPSWPEKTTYLKVGKSYDSEVDTLFLVSTVAHHVSILRLEIHSRMLDFLEAQPMSDDTRNDWWGLKLQRSRWWDLFDQDQRVEAFRALWGVMGWVMRDMTSEQPDADTEMTDAED